MEKKAQLEDRLADIKMMLEIRKKDQQELKQTLEQRKNVLSDLRLEVAEARRETGDFGWVEIRAKKKNRKHNSGE